MSIYSERLARLKKDIVTISQRKKKKRWKPNQKIMIDFINSVTQKATFIIHDHTIVLELGDSKKGFKHILERQFETQVQFFQN